MQSSIEDLEKLFQSIPKVFFNEIVFDKDNGKGPIKRREIVRLEFFINLRWSVSIDDSQFLIVQKKPKGEVRWGLRPDINNELKSFNLSWEIILCLLERHIVSLSRHKQGSPICTYI